MKTATIQGTGNNPPTVYHEHGSGLWFHSTTPEAVRSVIASAYRYRKRIRIFVGDVSTGRAWTEEFDVVGLIGRSTGEIKVPLLIESPTSMGGDAILDQCIVAIRDAEGFTYRHPTFDPGTWAVEPSGDHVRPFVVKLDGKIHGRFQTQLAAFNYAAFMRGERMSK